MLAFQTIKQVTGKRRHDSGRRLGTAVMKLRTCMFSQATLCANSLQLSPVGHPTVLSHSAQYLRAGRHQYAAPCLEIRHVGRRVHHPQRPAGGNQQRTSWSAVNVCEQLTAAAGSRRHDRAAGSAHTGSQVDASQNSSNTPLETCSCTAGTPPDPPIDLKGICKGAPLKPLAQHKLEDVPRLHRPERRREGGREGPGGGERA